MYEKYEWMNEWMNEPTYKQIKELSFIYCNTYTITNTIQLLSTLTWERTC